MNVVVAYACGIIALYIIAKIFVIPAKIVWKLLTNAFVGGITLLLINFVGGYFGINISINIVTALVAGVFGVPGIVLLLLAQYFLL